MRHQRTLFTMMGVSVVLITIIGGVWFVTLRRSAAAAINCPTSGFLTDLPQPERDICLERKFDAIEREREQRASQPFDSPPAAVPDAQGVPTDTADPELLAAEEALMQELAATAAVETLQSVHVVRPVERAEFVGTTLFVGSTSIWQNSAVEDIENQTWRPLYVYAMPAISADNTPVRLLRPSWLIRRRPLAHVMSECGRHRNQSGISRSPASTATSMVSYRLPPRPDNPAR